MALFGASVVVVTAVKVLLMQSYHSTDFDVHRNWLAITYSFPVKEWYFERTSIWTLDYPPFFAYFEWILAQVAAYIDPSMLNVNNLTYASAATVAFQRGSVMVTDMVLLSAAWYFLGGSTTISPSTEDLWSYAFTIGHVGLIMVDHIHFQYNGVLLGLLVWSFVLAERRQYLSMATCAATLMLAKHLFLPLAPLYAIFLLRTHCCSAPRDARSDEVKRFDPWAFMQLVALAAVLLGAAFGPFLTQSNGTDQMIQIFSRLFPFGRGLLHTYWAPNVWALYCAADMGLALLLQVPRESGLSPSSGLQGSFEPMVLPNVTAVMCMGLVVSAMLPALRQLWRAPSPQVLVRGAIYCSLCVFMLGYHVHEKAVLVPSVLTALIAFYSSSEAMLFIQLSMVAIHAQLPLLPRPEEVAVKVVLAVAYMALAMKVMQNKVSTASYVMWQLTAIVHCVVSVVREVVCPLAVAGTFGYTMQVLSSRYEFLPLLLTSVTNAMFMLPCWFRAWQLVVAIADEHEMEETLFGKGADAGDRAVCISREDSGEIMVAPLEKSEPGPSVLVHDMNAKKKKNRNKPKRRVSFSKSDQVLL